MSKYHPHKSVPSLKGVPRTKEVVALETQPLPTLRASADWCAAEHEPHCTEEVSQSQQGAVAW